MVGSLLRRSAACDPVGRGAGTGPVAEIEALGFGAIDELMGL
jgi:hypothetical protein